MAIFGAAKNSLKNSSSSSSLFVMIHYLRASDYGLVRSIITHPRIYPFAGDDAAPPVDEFRVVEDERVWYVLAYDSDQLLGGFMAYPQNAVCWEIHLLLLPVAWGRAAVICRGVFAWLFEQTDALRIVGATPVCYRLALKLSKAAGLVEYGLNPRAFLKWGKLHDVVLSGISKD